MVKLYTLIKSGRYEQNMGRMSTRKIDANQTYCDVERQKYSISSNYKHYFAYNYNVLFIFPCKYNKYKRVSDVSYRNKRVEREY